MIGFNRQRGGGGDWDLVPGAAPALIIFVNGNGPTWIGAADRLRTDSSDSADGGGAGSGGKGVYSIRVANSKVVAIHAIGVDSSDGVHGRLVILAREKRSASNLLLTGANRIVLSVAGVGLIVERTGRVKAHTEDFFNVGGDGSFASWSRVVKDTAY